MAERDTKDYWRKFCRENGPIIGAICDLLTEKQVASLKGEQILLFMAGMSAGIEQRPITGPQGDDWIEFTARGWQMGASEMM